VRPCFKCQECVVRQTDDQPITIRIDDYIIHPIIERHRSYHLDLLLKLRVNERHSSFGCAFSAAKPHKSQNEAEPELTWQASQKLFTMLNQTAADSGIPA
jgi:hypothetical protein